MKKSVVVLLHIGFWICYLILIIVILGMFFQGEPNPDQERLQYLIEIILLFALVPSVISFYSFYFYLFPKYLLQKKILLAIFYALLISLVSGWIGYALLALRFGGDCLNEEGAEGILYGLILFIALIALICGVIALVMQGFITWFGEIKLKETLKQKNQEMELALVKSQLDPHFLFNTINNIDVLILKNAHDASNYLNKLSDIMRFMLFETKTEEILLSKEIEYIEKYIELQKIRTSNLSYVDFVLKGEVNGKKIAPMIFIPFIENAFKHTNNKKVQNAIIITIFIEDTRIVFECKNKYDSSRKSQQESHGLGNELIEKRLNLLYGERHKSEIVNLNDLYSVRLTIEP